MAPLFPAVQAPNGRDSSLALLHPSHQQVPSCALNTCHEDTHFYLPPLPATHIRCSYLAPGPLQALLTSILPPDNLFPHQLLETENTLISFAQNFLVSSHSTDNEIQALHNLLGLLTPPASPVTWPPPNPCLQLHRLLAAAGTYQTLNNTVPEASTHGILCTRESRRRGIAGSKAIQNLNFYACWQIAPQKGLPSDPPPELCHCCPYILSLTLEILVKKKRYLILF